MRLIPISAGTFHCDGGALFGVIPKKLWNKVYPANDDNFIPIVSRCLYIETKNRKIIVETGIGDHYTEKYFNNNGYTPGNYLEKSLAKNGIEPNDITDVLLTHLHWDHCTGSVKNVDGTYLLTFPNANHWCSKIQWEHSFISNPREKAAYHREVLDFIHQTGKLNFLGNECELFPNIEVRIFNGHTPGQIIPFIHTENNETVVYTADLIPTAANIPLLWIASYDLYPVITMEEKERFLEEAAKNNYILFFEHDYFTECATVQKNDKGGFEVNAKFNWAER
ncbi:MAG: MBL fold metallo-hydrolase [Prolixibacteraceae bacterium]|nr:MBL fold metallo-hydrolase [Prolixibacteraceae bacterium]